MYCIVPANTIHILFLSLKIITWRWLGWNIIKKINCD